MTGIGTGFGWKAALAGVAALGASGCMAMDGYGGGYYGAGYGASGSAYNDRCYDAYDGYYDYYTDYDCYDRDDYRSGFSVNIGFGGGWWNDYYYPGYGNYMVDRYGARRQLYGNYLRYWGGRRAGHNWQRHHRGGDANRDGRGYRDGRRDHDNRRDHDGDRRDRSQRDRGDQGVGDRIVDRVERVRNRQDAGIDTPRARQPQARRPMVESRERVPARVERVERIERRVERAAPQRAAPAPEARPQAREARPAARSNEGRTARGEARVESKKSRPKAAKRDD